MWAEEGKKAQGFGRRLHTHLAVELGDWQSEQQGVAS